jgi:predicted nucleotidyltransferase component of viral defense system
MADQLYPTTLAEIPGWARANSVGMHEAVIRFMEYVVLTCIAASQPLSRSIAFKGGNALRFAYRSVRSTKDLDFSADSEDFPDDPQELRAILDDALKIAEREFGVRAKCQRVKRNPPSAEATHPTYDIAIGYQLPGDRYFQDFGSRPVPTTIPLEISFLDIVCETQEYALGGNAAPRLRVCSLEDILAEKLRSLLQQKTRNRNRPQDVFDIACFGMRYREEIDRGKIGRYLKRKSSIRELTVRKCSFDSDIRELAAFEYEKRIGEQARESFIPFETAWAEVLSLVSTLDIPD